MVSNNVEGKQTDDKQALEYVVRSVPLDDSNEGWIFLRSTKDLSIENLKGRRRIVKIARKYKAIYCEALYADDPYLRRFADNFVKEDALVQLVLARGTKPRNNQCPAVEKIYQYLDDQPNLIFISHWYRQRLGIENPQHNDLIEAVNGTKVMATEPLTVTLDTDLGFLTRKIALYLACLEHPQSVVFVGTLLALVGTGLGLIGFGLGMFGITEWLKGVFDPAVPFVPPVGLIVALVGLVVTLYALFWGPRRRYS